MFENEALFIVTLFMTMTLCYLVFRFFGRIGLIAWISFAVILANLEVLKIVDLFGIETCLGNILFGTIYLAMDVLVECYGRKTATRALYAGFVVFAVFTLLTQIDILFIPAESDFISPAFQQLFEMVPRMCLASIASYLVGNFIDVRMYAWFRDRQGERSMWIRSNVTKLFVQLLDNVILFTIAYIGVYDLTLILTLSVTAWIVEFIVTVCDTPFMYACRKHAREKGWGRYGNDMKDTEDFVA